MSAELRQRAAEAHRSAAEWTALARAAAVVGKRVPDRLLAELETQLAHGQLEQHLRALLELPEGAALPRQAVGGLAALLRQQVERAGELITELTESAVRKAAEQQGRAGAFAELAAEQDRTLDEAPAGLRAEEAPPP